MITCTEVKLSLSRFLRGQLPAQDRVDLHRHLAVCDACTRTVEGARDAMELSRSACAAARDPSAEDVPEALLLAIQFTSHLHR